MMPAGSFQMFGNYVVVVVVVVVSHIQCNILATIETTVTQRVSDRPIKGQTRSWLQGGTEVNGSHLLIGGKSRYSNQ